MTMDTIFRIASQTKALTSVAILQLMEEGKLDAQRPVGRYIPDVRQDAVAVANERGIGPRAGASGRSRSGIC